MISKNVMFERTKSEIFILIFIQIKINFRVVDNHMRKMNSIKMRQIA